VSENLQILATYSAAMEAGDTDPVNEFWAPDFQSHVTSRVSPELVDVRARSRGGGRGADVVGTGPVGVPGHDLTVNLVIESGDLVVSNWRSGGVQLDSGGDPHR
jgi:hypothetical protein